MTEASETSVGMVMTKQVASEKRDDILKGNAWIIIYFYQSPWIDDGLTPVLPTAEARARDTKDFVLNEEYYGPCTHSGNLAACVYETAHNHIAHS